jgi:hypothetical protein
MPAKNNENGRATELLPNTSSQPISGNSQEGTFSPGSSKKKFVKNPPYGAIKPIPIKPNRRSSSRNRQIRNRQSRNRQSRNRSSNNRNR